MAREAFEVIVGVSGQIESERVAIAEASSYLSYGDTSDTVGLTSEIIDVDTYGGGDGRDWGIGLTVSLVIENDDELKRFMDEMVALAKVESVERVGIQGLDKVEA